MLLGNVPKRAWSAKVIAMTGPIDQRAAPTGVA